MKISVVIPIYNEIENTHELYQRVTEELIKLNRDYELLLVDDGSTDGTVEILRELAASDERVRPVLLRRNFGQTAAMKAGIDVAEGDVIITMDGDLQNDPADIGMMLDKIDEGYDLVHGWRKNRKDAFLNRKLPSKIANWLISRTTGFPIHDLGCTLKAIRSDVAKELELYGEMHRFIPILAHQRGARCIEVVARHHPRTRGKTKYGIGRTLRVVLDLITVKYMLDYFASPMKVFGRIGIACGMIGMGSAIGAALMKAMSLTDITGNPLFLLSILSTMLSIQFFSLGILGEVNARIYFNSPDRQQYAIREIVKAQRLRQNARAA
jgi:glycosyltransferase involved in cell wall biosynthesis